MFAGTCAKGCVCCIGGSLGAATGGTMTGACFGGGGGPEGKRTHLSPTTGGYDIPVVAIGPWFLLSSPRRARSASIGPGSATFFWNELHDIAFLSMVASAANAWPFSPRFASFIVSCKLSAFEMAEDELAPDHLSWPFLRFPRAEGSRSGE